MKRKIYLYKRGDFDKVRMDISEFVADFVRTNTVNASMSIKCQSNIYIAPIIEGRI